MKAKGNSYNKGKASAARGSTQYSSPIGGAGNDEGGRFVDRNLVPVNPNTEQFAPSDAEPVRARFKMGGGC